MSSNHRSSGSSLITMLLFVSSLGLVGGFTTSCQHARVRLGSPEPRECRLGLLPRRKCDEIMNARKEKVAKSPETLEKHVIEQEYYLMGLYPDEKVYKAEDFCPGKAIYEVYQYSTFMDGLYEQLTLGIYSPRTLEVTCY